MKELNFDQMEGLKGGALEVMDCTGMVMALIGLGFLVAFPPSAFLIPVVGTFAGVGAGISIGSCLM